MRLLILASSEERNSKEAICMISLIILYPNRAPRYLVIVLDRPRLYEADRCPGRNTLTRISIKRLIYNINIQFLLRNIELTCNFDVSMCGFKQAKDDKFDWTRYRRNTSSSGKGPFSDHTTGNMTGEL